MNGPENNAKARSYSWAWTDSRRGTNRSGLLSAPATGKTGM